jgi:lipoprotein-anchoring transpeptidase ErfK/SrfK
MAGGVRGIGGRNVSVKGSFITGRLAGRVAFIGLLVLGAAGCTTASESTTAAIDPLVLQMYAPVQGEPFRIPAIPIAKVDPKLIRQTVPTPANIASEKPGTVVVDPANKFLYLVQDGGRSLRYGIGVGKAGFAWAGEAEIHDKQHWPKWFPPAEMQQRETFQKLYPDFAQKYPNGMDGSPKNPLGSRALYLWANNKDTLFRIHATSDWTSIGNAMSSGCIRMWNQDVMDLYDRVEIGTRVVVLQGPGYTPLEQITAPAVATAPAAGVPPSGEAMPATLGPGTVALVDPGVQ